MYVGTSTGDVLAVNADTGRLVWKTATAPPGLIGGIFAPSVDYGRVYALVGGSSPLAVALDRQTGKTLWRTKLKDASASGVNASAVVFDGLLFAAVFGGDGDPTSHPPFFILDAHSGRILKKTYIIPKTMWKKGYAGSGIWATGVVDEKTQYLYTGTSNPYSKKHESNHSNAILKIDMDRNRATFGQIVDSYKGNVEQYFPGLDKQPACQYLGDLQTAGYSVFCAQLDIDFGASPNLFTDSKGHELVGDLQKAGVYHAAFADTMKPAWSTVLSTPSAGGNAGTAAVGPDGIYAVSNPGVLNSLDRTTGKVQWRAPMPDGTHYETVSTANGVVYATDNRGMLNVFDAKTGTILAERPLSADAGDGCTDLSGGISIARHTVYVTCDIGASGGGWIIAFALPNSG
jgi:outer membrane protein assembly factor BamB